MNLNISMSTRTAFERSSKRRGGFPSETEVKHERVVHGHKELAEDSVRITYVTAAWGESFKKCCMFSGCCEGSKRRYYF